MAAGPLSLTEVNAMNERPPISIVLRSIATILAILVLGALLIVALVRLGDHLSPRESSGVQPLATADRAVARPSSPGTASETPRVIGGHPQDPSSSPFVGVAEAVIPTVVSVETERTLSPDERPDLRRFFPDMGDGEEIEIPSSGSGFILDSDGYVITNNHVIRDASSISVTLADGSSHSAELVGTDPATDVALLKIDAGRSLPHVTMGNSDDLRIGEWVAAIGNPFGNLEGSLTVGVVSAKGRNSLGIAGGAPTYQDFIQTDASINFGNSGGPLVNTRGEAVGINTAFNGPGRGIGFAIAMNMAQRVVADLKREGRVLRGYLGIRLGVPAPEMAQDLGLPEGEGILVREVMDGTPAQKAGLEAGDVIVEIDGLRATDVPSFMMHIADTPVGEEVKVRFIRDGREVVTRVRLMERPGDVDGPPERNIIDPEDPDEEPESDDGAPSEDDELVPEDDGAPSEDDELLPEDDGAPSEDETPSDDGEPLDEDAPLEEEDDGLEIPVPGDGSE
jgi:S1-C subfamily serine protease